jgi:UDP-N-acetylmuramoyl-L-alanyl-D-glutamate--2,6-diaminopimelate ligase
MILEYLAAALGELRVIGSLDCEIGDITMDSRMVKAGSLFIAVRGEHADGHDFVEQAVAAGARAVVVDRDHARAYAGAVTIVVGDPRRALSSLSARFYGDPSRSMTVVGVTGTNGKTTTTHLIAAILQAVGIPTGCVGTLGARFAERTWPLMNTTPPAPEMQRLLAEMQADGARMVAMEVSSHALAFEHVADVRFEIGVLTNVTRDHLDFHRTLQAYARAKRRLFEQSLFAVLNIDDAYGRVWIEELRERRTRCLSYGFSPEADVRAENIILQGHGSKFTVGEQHFITHLSGHFNVSNVLAALCVVRTLGVSDEKSAEVLAGFTAVPGRMEHLGDGEIDVVVDYAHTPDALENVLRAARETAQRRVIVVFGCGGDRDRGKRPQMGRIAAELADHVFVTSDNPRTEEPRAIIDEIMVGVTDTSHVCIEPDRGEAVAAAIVQAARGDVVVVAGKGHETYQIIGTQTRHFDDREAVREGFARRTALAARALR